jgi:hypothetical protein
VEIRSTNDELREILYRTKPGDPLFSNWTSRRFGLSSYIGDTIRLTFRIKDVCGPINVHLDNVNLQTEAFVPTIFDVYFGTNPNPGTAEYQGSSTNATWAPAKLQLNTTYFWKIVARRGPTEVTGPVWQFRTRNGLPVHHFEVSNVSSPQAVGKPFAITVIAKDDANNTATNFTGQVVLTGFTTTGSSRQFFEDFEDGNSGGWIIREGAYTRTVTEETAGRGSYSFSLIGGYQRPDDGISRDLPELRPNQVNFYVRASATNKAGGYLVVRDSHGFTGIITKFYMNPTGKMGVYANQNGFHWTNYVANEWYHILLTFDWSRRTVGFAVNGIPIATDIPYDHEFAWRILGVDLFNLDDTQNWWDEIEFIEGNLRIPVAITPGICGNFVDGIWTGSITALEAANNVYLLADDGSGHAGSGNMFSVVPSLAIMRSGATAIISWPASATGFWLEEANGLSPPSSWVPMTNSPLVAGDRKFVTNALSDTTKFYRLRGP